MGLWENLDQRYRELYRFAFRLLGRHEVAEDVVQEAFLRLARDGPDGLEGESVRRWLYVTTRNLCVSHFRTSARHPEVTVDTFTTSCAPGPNPAETAAAGERSTLVKAAIEHLPLAMREALVLREYEGMNYAQIADITGCSLGTVKSRLARAREQLRKQLRPLWEEDQ